MNSPSRVFAVIPPSGNVNERDLNGKTAPRETSGNRLRELQVTGAAEVSSPADRASLRISVSNNKESVNEVTSSISRRLEYILQTLRQHEIREEDTSVRRFLHHDADNYHMDAEVVITFSDFQKMERICSILLEKLDKSVCVGIPRFYHSPEFLSQLRQQACVLAVENAQQKASKVSLLLGQNLGAPLLVREEETKERRSEDEGEGGVKERPSTHLPHLPTVAVSSQVSVSFSFRDGSKRKL